MGRDRMKNRDCEGSRPGRGDGIRSGYGQRRKGNHFRSETLTRRVFQLRSKRCGDLQCF